jgi:hypothetical protein
MREAAIPGYRLSKARRSTRVLTSLGLLGLFLGLLSASLLTLFQTGIFPSDVRRYYLGTAAAEASSAESNANTDLDQLLAPASPQSFLQLAEVTHIHVTAGSLLLFLLCHLLALCEVSENFRTGMYVAAFTAFLGTFGTPWLIVYVDPAFAWIFGPFITGLLVLLGVLVFVPLREMWWRCAS